MGRSENERMRMGMTPISMGKNSDHSQPRYNPQLTVSAQKHADAYITVCFPLMIDLCTVALFRHN